MEKWALSVRNAMTESLKVVVLGFAVGIDELKFSCKIKCFN